LLPTVAPSADRSLPPRETREPGARAAWALTWISYASYYFGRKNLSVTKAAIARAFGDRALYGVDTAYLAAYAVGQYGSGWLGDRIGARRLVGAGMLVAAAACFAFGLSSSGVFFLTISLVNGLAQSTGWPGNVKAMEEWTSPVDRGRAMGLWSTCYQVGGIAATLLATRMLATLGWRFAYFVPAAFIGASGLSVLLFLPRRRRGRVAGQPARSERHSLGVAGLPSKQRSVASSRALWCYGASYFFIKLIRYSLLFWLPYYLHVVLHYSQGSAGYWSTAFEIGGVGGAVGLGWLSDRAAPLSRSTLCAGSLVGLAIALVAYIRVGALHPVWGFFVMMGVGALLYGPDSLLSGAAAQDLGGKDAAALAAGMINGFGSFGAVLQELMTRTASRLWGWNAVFGVLVASALLAALALMPTFATRRRPPSR
jgi:OPA family sugar phosphate sensor protein UhpC-like MFS transporter